MVNKLKRMLMGGSAAEPWPLDWPIWNWSRWDKFTFGNAVEGVACFGGTGSGKSSAVLRRILLAYLSNNFGGLVLTVKPDDAQQLRQYCAMTGRTNDLIEFGPGQPYRFDPLSFEASRGGQGAGLGENLSQMLNGLSELTERQQAGGARNSEPFWKNSQDKFQRNAIDLCMMGTATVRVSDLYQTAISIPQSLEEARSDQWQNSSHCYKLLRAADQRPKTQRQYQDFKLVADYFLAEIPALTEKTRSVIISGFTANIDLLNRGVLGEYFGNGTNIDPTAIERGKIIVVNMPIKTFGQAGLIGNALWKSAFMRSIERRDTRVSPRICFMIQDEAQNLVLARHDQLFTSTCRSSKVANVILTQSVSGMMAQLGGGPAGRAECDSLLSNFGTRLFCSQSDPVTNEYASMLIGRCKDWRVSGNNSYGGPNGMFDGGYQTGGSAGINEIIDFEVQPREFTRLRTGGRANRYLVDAIVFRNGMPFKATDRNWMSVVFDQNQK